MSADNQTRDQHRTLKLVESQNSRQFSQTLDNTRQKLEKKHSLSTWARQFIAETGLSKANCRDCETFKNLNIKEKKAIYYQLNKNTQISNKMTKAKQLQRKEPKIIKKTKELTNSMSLKLASLGLIPVIASEIILISFAYHFYLEINFSLLMAILAAISVEIFYLMASSSKQWSLKLLKFPIYTYAIFTVCYSLYINDPKLITYNGQFDSQLKALEEGTQSQRQITANLKQQLDSTLADMNVFRERGLVSRGRAAISEEKATLQRKIEESQTKLESLQSQIITLKSKESLIKSEGIFTASKISKIEPRTWAVMAFLALMQLLSSVFIHEFSKSLSSYFQRRKKLNNKIKINKEVYWQSQTSH